MKFGIKGDREKETINLYKAINNMNNKLGLNI